MGDIASIEKKIVHLEAEDELLDAELSMAQKKKALKEAKKSEGKDWKKVLGLAKGLKINSEVLHDMYAADLGPLREQTKLGTRRLR